jgi:hypothetical protein
MLIGKPVDTSSTTSTSHGSIALSGEFALLLMPAVSGEPGSESVRKRGLLIPFVGAF